MSRRIEHVVAATAANTGLTLLMAFNYGGRTSSWTPSRTGRSGAIGRPSAGDIDEVRVSRALYTDGVQNRIY